MARESILLRFFFALLRRWQVAPGVSPQRFALAQPTRGCSVRRRHRLEHSRAPVRSGSAPNVRRLVAARVARQCKFLDSLRDDLALAVCDPSRSLLRAPGAPPRRSGRGIIRADRLRQRGPRLHDELAPAPVLQVLRCVDALVGRRLGSTDAGFEGTARHALKGRPWNETCSARTRRHASPSTRLASVPRPSPDDADGKRTSGPPGPWRCSCTSSHPFGAGGAPLGRSGLPSEYV